MTLCRLAHLAQLRCVDISPATSQLSTSGLCTIKALAEGAEAHSCHMPVLHSPRYCGNIMQSRTIDGDGGYVHAGGCCSSGQHAQGQRGPTVPGTCAVLLADLVTILLNLFCLKDAYAHSCCRHAVYPRLGDGLSCRVLNCTCRLELHVQVGSVLKARGMDAGIEGWGFVSADSPPAQWFTCVPDSSGQGAGPTGCQ